MKSYKLKNWQPIKMITNLDKGNTLNDEGNGWYNQDLSQFIKISWQKVNEKWVAVEGATEQEIQEKQQAEMLEQISLLNQKWKSDGL